MLRCSETGSVPTEEYLDHFVRKHHPVEGEPFFLQMRKILYSMEFENLKRLLGWEFRCAGRSKILSFEDAFKKIRFKTVNGLSF